MGNIFNEKPTLLLVIIISLALGLFTSLFYARGDNYLAETSAICTFFLALAVFSYFANTKRCLYIIFISLISGSLSGIIYWYAMPVKMELISTIIYGALIGVGLVILDSTLSSESCT